MRIHRHPTLLALLGILWGCLALAGCSGLAPGGGLPEPAPTQTAAQPSTPTAALTATPTASPVATPTPKPTHTATLTPTVTASPTATPTPSPTPLPGTLLAAARQHQVNGEYPEAIAAYQAVLADQPNSDEARQALFHLAESQQLSGDDARAAATWEQYILAYPDDGLLPQVHFMAGRAYQASDDCPRAIAHFRSYLRAESALADLAYEWIGDCHAESLEPAEAISAYEKALEIVTDRSVAAALRQKIAARLLDLERYEAAVSQYDAILAIAQRDAYRSEIEYLAGRALAAAGETEKAHARYRRAVERYPSTDYAYWSLVELVNAEVVVDEFQRGLVDYYAGDSFPDAYGAAIRAFDRYLAAKPAAKADEALYRKALAQRALGQIDDALDTLEILILDHPQSKWLASAWYEKAVTLAEKGDVQRAVKTYQDVAAFFPAHELAPKALWAAAQSLEREGELADAARMYEMLQADFPGFEDADAALWRAALTRYMSGSPPQAIADWRALTEKYPNSSFLPASLYWLGKLAREDDPSELGGYWDRLLERDPRGYYALRVRQIRGGASVTRERLVVGTLDPPTWDPEQAQAEVLTWLRGWSQVPTTTRLIDVPASLTTRQNLSRGQALLSVGMRRSALTAFDAARASAWSDPIAMAQLAFFFHQQGVYGLAARCAARLAGLWPGGTIHDAPLALQRLAYPLPYADLLSLEAEAAQLDPLLLAALIRQESLFEPAAESYAGARGLGQVMPATGEGIAKSLGMEGFTVEDLYRPCVSIRFAAFYLAAQLKRFDDQLLVALAAYNGGPGNTLRWLERSSGDLDLFVEVITASQSRSYLQRVYEQYITYESLYR